MDAEVVAQIDVPYRTILDAADRDSAKNTYIDAAKLAKRALTEARSRALTPAATAPAAYTTDSAPNFAPLVSDPTMQGILERRWDECKRCIDANAPLAATVMMGGLLEALLVARANKLSDKSKLFKATATPIDPKTKKSVDLRQWTLGPYIDVGHELKWISNSAKHVAVILRDYRNYIHPEKERSHGITLSCDDALMFWEVTKTLSRELVAMKGET
jgi:nucleotide-binding universal stress UspA family protein